MRASKLRCWLFGHKDTFIETGRVPYYLMATMSVDEPTHAIRVDSAVGFMRCERCGREGK